MVQVFDKSPANRDGRIRCGDEIVAVNGITVKGERKSAVAQLIQVSLNPVKVLLSVRCYLITKQFQITINKLDDVNTKGKTLDILIKKAKHKVVEFMDTDSADALGLSRAILTNDPLAEKEKILEENAEFYRHLVAYFGDMFQYQQKITDCQKGMDVVILVVSSVPFQSLAPFSATWQLTKSNRRRMKHSVHLVISIV